MRRPGGRFATTGWSALEGCSSALGLVTLEGDGGGKVSWPSCSDIHVSFTCNPSLVSQGIPRRMFRGPKTRRRHYDPAPWTAAHEPCFLECTGNEAHIILCRRTPVSLPLTDLDLGSSTLAHSGCLPCSSSIRRRDKVKANLLPHLPRILFTHKGGHRYHRGLQRFPPSSPTPGVYGALLCDQRPTRCD